MIAQHQPANPEIHAAADRLAERCVEIDSGPLRPEERHECAREFYLVAREIIREIRK